MSNFPGLAPFRWDLEYGHCIRCKDPSLKGNILVMTKLCLMIRLSFLRFGEYEVHTISFLTFFAWALLLIVHTWNSSPLQSNLLRLQCTGTVPTNSQRPHGSPLVWACQWPSSQPLSSSQLSHNDSLWA